MEPPIIVRGKFKELTVATSGYMHRHKTVGHGVAPKIKLLSHLLASQSNALEQVSSNHLQSSHNVTRG